MRSLGDWFDERRRAWYDIDSYYSRAHAIKRSPLPTLTKRHPLDGGDLMYRVRWAVSYFGGCSFVYAFERNEAILRVAAARKLGLHQIHNIRKAPL